MRERQTSLKMLDEFTCVESRDEGREKRSTCNQDLDVQWTRRMRSVSVLLVWGWRRHGREELTEDPGHNTNRPEVAHSDEQAHQHSSFAAEEVCDHDSNEHSCQESRPSELDNGLVVVVGSVASRTRLGSLSGRTRLILKVSDDSMHCHGLCQIGSSEHVAEGLVIVDERTPAIDEAESRDRDTELLEARQRRHDNPHLANGHVFLDIDLIAVAKTFVRALQQHAHHR